MRKVWRAFSWWFLVGACVAIGAVGVLAIRSVSELHDADRAVRASRDLNLAAELLLSGLRDAETGQRGYLITNRESYLIPYHAAVVELPQLIANVDAMTAYDPLLHELALELAQASRDKLAEIADTVQLQSTDALQAHIIVMTDRGENLMRRARALVAKIQSTANQRLIARRAVADRGRQFVIVGVGSTAALSILLLLTLAYVLRRDANRIKQREEQLATTLGSIGDAVVATDELGHVTYMNPVAVELAGCGVTVPPQAFADAFCLIDESTGGPAQDPVDRVLREGVMIELANHTALVRPDGRAVPIEDSAAPLRNDDGSVRGVVFVFKDVTERRRAVDALALANARLESIMEAGEIGTWTWEANTRRITGDRNLIQLYDLSTGEVEAADIEHYYARVHPDDLSAVKERNELALQSGVLEMAEFRIVRPDGSIRWLTARGVVQFGARGEPELLLGLNMDITQLKRSEEELRIADRRKNEFLAILAHELRNPLAPIRHAVKLLGAAETSDIQRRWSHDVISRQVRHMARLLDDLLDIARITRGQLELKREPTALQTIVMDAIDTARPLIEAKRHRLDTSLPSYSIMLDVDAVRIAQVLSNLLTNAAKYMDEAGTITLSAELESDELTISVKDAGLGISKESLPRLFEMFSQVNTSLDRAEGGLGIGLALVAGLMSLHGGRVEARSAGVGRGSEFVVHLPRALIRARAAPADPAAAPPVTKPVLQGKVLVADDNQDAANSLALLLELAGHQVLTAHSGAQAIEVGARERPRVILLDIGMPGMSGYEAARRIRGSDWGKHAVLIAVTGWGQREDKEKAAEAGFDHHLTKPVDPDYVEQLLAQCFSEIA
jgi:PAS domain S-box-containing protein